MWTLQHISTSTHKLHWNVYLWGEICVFSIGKFLLYWGHWCYGVSYSSVQHSWGNYCKMSVILLHLQRSRYLSLESQRCSPFFPALSAFISVSLPQALTPRAPLVTQAPSLPFQMFRSAAVRVVPPGWRISQSWGWGNLSDAGTTWSLRETGHSCDWACLAARAPSLLVPPYAARVVNRSSFLPFVSH